MAPAKCKQKPGSAVSYNRKHRQTSGKTLLVAKGCLGARVSLCQVAAWFKHQGGRPNKEVSYYIDYYISSTTDQILSCCVTRYKTLSSECRSIDPKSTIFTCCTRCRTQIQRRRSFSGVSSWRAAGGSQSISRHRIRR